MLPRSTLTLMNSLPASVPSIPDEQSLETVFDGGVLMQVVAHIRVLHYNPLGALRYFWLKMKLLLLKDRKTFYNKVAGFMNESS